MSATVNASASATVPALLIPALSALASLPARPRFEDTPQGKAFASMDEKTRETLAEIINNARKAFDAENLANPYEETEIAIAQILAANVPADKAGSTLENVRARYFALIGLRNVTDKEISAALIDGKGEVFDILAQIFARVKLAKETVSCAEGVRLAKLSPNSYGAVNKWLAAGVSVDKPTGEGDKVSPVSVDSILAPAARKWAKANSLALAKS